MTLINTKEKSEQKAIKIYHNKPKLSWLPKEYENLYQRTDLLYSKCLELFGKIEAVMRDDIPETTMRQWFIEFIKAGWTSEMVSRRYNALIRKPKYGSITFSDWVNAVPIYGEDEINLIVKRRIENLIWQGKHIINNIDNLDATIIEQEREAIEVAVIKELEYYYKVRKSEIIEIIKEQIKNIISNKSIEANDGNN